jgi:Cu/Ag efflux protein CusF
MRTLVAAMAAIAVWTAGPALASDYTRGEVTKIDPQQKKLTIRHEEIRNLDMPPMTMVFVVAEDAMLDRVSVGQQIEFIAERVNGRITVTDIK